MPLVLPIRTGLPLAGLLLMLSAGADARAEARVVMVTPFGGLGVPSAEVGRVQYWMEAALARVPKVRWVSAARVHKLIRGSARLAGCLDRPHCLAGLARQVGADLWVSGEVGSLGGGYMVYLRLSDSSGRSLRSANGVLEPNRDGLRKAARELAVRLLEPERYTGTLRLRVDVANAWIYLDGKRVARSPTAPLTRVPVGTHALRVTHEAYQDFVRFVRVGFAETSIVEIKLTAFPVRSEQMRLVGGARGSTLSDRELPWYRRWWALTALGAVVLAGSATAAALLFSQTTSRDAELVIRRP